MKRVEKKAIQTSLLSQLIETAVSEDQSLEMGLEQLVTFTTDYGWLINEMTRMEKNTGRVFKYIQRFDKPHLMAISGDSNYDQMTTKQLQKLKTKAQRLALEKRKNDQSSNETSRFSIVNY